MIGDFQCQFSHIFSSPFFATHLHDVNFIYNNETNDNKKKIRKRFRLDADGAIRVGRLRRRKTGGKSLGERRRRRHLACGEREASVVCSLSAAPQLALRCWMFPVR